MPPRSSRFSTPAQVNQLPILPFLAPRVFTPWPKLFPARRAYSTEELPLQTEQSLPIRRIKFRRLVDAVSTNSAKSHEIQQAEDPGVQPVEGPPIRRGAPPPAYHATEQAQNPSPRQAENGTKKKKKDYRNIVYKSFADDAIFENRLQLRLARIARAPFGEMKRLERELSENPEEAKKFESPLRQAFAAAMIKRLETPSEEMHTEKEKRRHLSKDAIRGMKVDMARRRRQESRSLTERSRYWWVRYSDLSVLNGYTVPLLHWNRGLVIQPNVRSQALPLQEPNPLEPSWNSSSEATLEAITKKWYEHDETWRKENWYNVILSTLQREPTAAIKVLLATSLRPPYPPSFAMSDVLESIANYYLAEENHRDELNTANILEAIFQLLEKGPQDLQLSQKTLYHILVHAEVEQAEKLYRVLEERGHPMENNTLLHLVNLLCTKGRSILSMDLMVRLYNQGADFSSDAVLSTCVTLLRREPQEHDEATSDSRLFGLLLDLGLEPDLITYNTLLHNILLVDDMEAGWRVFDLILDHGFEPDAHTYSILLNNAKSRMDTASIGRVLDAIRQKNIRNPYIGNDILHSIYLLAERDIFEYTKNPQDRERPPSSFTRMLAVYKTWFKTQPLTRLLGRNTPENPQTSDGEIFPPSAATLNLMAIAYLRQNRGPQFAIEFYDHFRTQLVKGNPDVLKIVEQTHLYNAFIGTFGLHHDTLHLCPRVLSDMLDPIPDSNQDHSKPHCRPDVRTWSILLGVYMRHQQPRAAEKVLNMMLARGIRPNDVTWSSLVRGYASMQDIPSTLHSMQRMQDQGWDTDAVAISTMRKIRNAQDMRNAMHAWQAKRPSDFNLEAFRASQWAKLRSGVEKMVRKAEKAFEAYPGVMGVSAADGGGEGEGAGPAHEQQAGEETVEGVGVIRIGDLRPPVPVPEGELLSVAAQRKKAWETVRDVKKAYGMLYAEPPHRDPMDKPLEANEDGNVVWNPPIG